MADLNELDVEFLIDCLKKDREIPPEYKYALFPTKQKEYELQYSGKLRKEDVLADNEEAKAVPLQVEKTFNGKSQNTAWQNLLVFGDNLQTLKTLYKDQDPLIAGKVKGKVKLMYIDPPFATEKDFRTRGGEQAYSDKKKGADFIEFFRRRMLVAKELLASDGTIYVHIDARKGHYVKVILDEIFSGMDFAEIVWVCGLMGSGKFYPKSHEVLLCYKSPDAYFDPPSRLGYSDYIKKDLKLDSKGWYYSRRQESSGGKNSLKTYISENPKHTKEEALSHAATERPQPAWDVWVGKEDIAKSFNDYGVGTYSFKQGEGTGYPTQKPEELLSRIIKASSRPGDLVMDFFSGSGTTLAVAEKLNRRWIGCDVGKLAVYTTQKRLLRIAETKSLTNTSQKHAKEAASFSVLSSGLYDLGKVFALKKDEYRSFVNDLFEVESVKSSTVGGIEVDGKKRGFFVKIFPYWESENVSVDESYIENLHEHMGSKIEGRMYIIVPANNVDFINDYYEVGKTKYYFLKVPYQIIKELHRVQFKKLRQPQSKKNVNDLDEAIGFHFVRQPEVISTIKRSRSEVKLTIKKFESAYSKSVDDSKLNHFDNLAMVLVDLDHDDEKFLMTKWFFAEDLLNRKAVEDSDLEEALRKQTEISISFNSEICGERIAIIYIDVYGNEFREVMTVQHD